MARTAVAVAFYERWGIKLELSYEALTDGYLPFNSCGLAHHDACGSSCGVCVDGYDPTYQQPIHHKNIYANMKWLKDNRSLSGKNILLLLTNTTTCASKNYVHTLGILGLAELSGSYAIATMQGLQGLQPERVIQHELSHNFGAEDGCKSSWCIMNYGSLALQNPEFYRDDIWCKNCKNDFNRNQHQ
jgi:hypothetical protein